MRNQYEHGLYIAEDDYTGLSLVSEEAQIEGFIRVEEACHIEILKSKPDINGSAVLYPYNDYADSRKQHKNELYSAEDDYTGY